jgi:glycolate oxidase FAD binding subunit
VTADADQTQDLAQAVAYAYGGELPLMIAAGASKAFLGEQASGQPLNVSNHRGVVHYEPGELVLTARAGTPLAEIEQVLAEKNQRLAFEPPHYGATATLGGTIAAGVSGPARPYAGAARDFVLGARIINGRGEVLRFGGEVMKNVAGYDLSRLMAGAYGTLGVLLDISLKVLPAPCAQATLTFEHDAATALAQFNRWAAKPWPITGAYWEDGRSYLRLAGAESAVHAACEALAGEALDKDAAFWRSVREHERPFFQNAAALWRLAVAPAAPMPEIAGDYTLDWGGAQRWLVPKANAEAVRRAAHELGGHASIYRGDASPRFHPLPRRLLAVHRRVKQSLDPAGILNRGRLYPEF